MIDTHILVLVGGLVVAFVVSAALLVLWIAAVVGILRSRALDASNKALWILGTLAFPVIGPIFWFIVASRLGRPANVRNGADRVA